MDMTQIGTLHKEIPLPKTYGELDKEMTKAFVQYSGSLLKKLMAENRQVIFPRGEGSAALLNKDYNAVFPHVIAKDEDGNWDAFVPEETKDADLGNNGYLAYGQAGSTYYFYIHKPDDISMKRFLDDSKLFMDLLLKGVYVYRVIGSEKIKIVSMGKAQEEHPFTDSYGRKWIVRTWRQEFNDQMYAIFALPVPGGAIAMLRVDDTGSIHSGHIPDLKVLTDFIYLSYYGTFKEWREFLTLKDKLPSIFSTLDIRIKNNKAFSFHSPRFSASYGPDLMTVSDDSDLNLRFSFFRDHGKTVWDIDGIVVGDNKHNKVSYAIFRNAPPPETLSDDFQSNWEKIVKRQFPYNRSAYTREDATSIITVYGKTSGGPEKESPELLYTVGYSGSGTVAQEQMEAKLDGFLKKVKVFETGNMGSPVTASREGSHLGKR
jgi:serine protease Do